MKTELMLKVQTWKTIKSQLKPNNYVWYFEYDKYIKNVYFKHAKEVNIYVEDSFIIVSISYFDTKPRAITIGLHDTEDYSIYLNNKHYDNRRNFKNN